MTSIAADPVFASEVQGLLGMTFYDVENPRKFRQLQDVIDFFGNNPNARRDILKVLNGKPGMDKLDLLWGYTELQKEYRKRVNDLPKEDFTDDIQEELKRGYITDEKLKIVKQQLKEKIKPSRDHKKEDKMQKKELGAVDDAVGASEKHEKILQAIESVENIKREVEAYD